MSCSYDSSSSLSSASSYFDCCSSGLCPVVCKRDVVSGVCCVACLVVTKRVECTAITKRTYFKRRQTHRQRILNNRFKHRFVLHIVCCFNLF